MYIVLEDEKLQKDLIINDYIIPKEVLQELDKRIYHLILNIITFMKNNDRNVLNRGVLDFHLNPSVKICTKCKTPKPRTTEYFNRSSYTIDNLSCHCKVCKSNDWKKYLSDPTNYVRRKAQQEAYRQTDRFRETNYKYRSTEEFKNNMRQYLKDYYQNNKDKWKNYTSSEMQKIRKQKYNRQPKIRLYNAIRGGLSRNLTKLNTCKNNPSLTYIGCTLKELEDHLNSGQYTMEDYQTNKKGDVRFHIDHIIPSKYYLDKIEVDEEGNITPETEPWLYKWWNYRNLRVFPASENSSKSASIDMNLIKEYNIEDLLYLK